MNKPTDPQLLAEDILHRSHCAVQVGAVIADRHGIFSWAWNHVGDGRGLHAEQFAIQRANPKRLNGSSIYVAGQRRRNGRIVLAMPCKDCLYSIYMHDIKRIYWRDPSGGWQYSVHPYREMFDFIYEQAIGY